LSPDEAVVSEALRSLEAFFDVADGLLRQNNYMAGDEFTLVDIYYIPEVLALFAYGYGDMIVSREAVNAWWNRCVNRPGIQKRLAADKQTAGSESG
jgi:glutathione S-transferase